MENRISSFYSRPDTLVVLSPLLLMLFFVRFSFISLSLITFASVISSLSCHLVLSRPPRVIPTLLLFPSLLFFSHLISLPYSSPLTNLHSSPKGRGRTHTFLLPSYRSNTNLRWHPYATDKPCDGCRPQEDEERNERVSHAQDLRCNFQHNIVNVRLVIIVFKKLTPNNTW